MIDEKVGEVIDILKKHNAYDDTVIIYSSDHGDFMGDYGLVEKLQCLEDSLMRVPLFVKPPIAGFSGIRVKEPVVNIDIASTCMELSETPLEAPMLIILLCLIGISQKNFVSVHISIWKQVL